MFGRRSRTTDPDALVQEKWSVSFGRFQRRVLEEEETRFYEARQENKRFSLSLRRKDLFAWATNRVHRYDNFILDGTVHFGPGNGHSAIGFLLRYVDPSNFYYFLVSNEGHFRFDLVFNGNPTPLISWTPAGPLNRSIDENDPLSLRIISRDGRFLFLADQEWIGEVDDDTIRAGRVAFAAQNFGELERGDFHLDNLAVSSLPVDVERDFLRWTDVVPVNPSYRLALAKSFFGDRQFAPAVVQVRRALRGRQGTTEELFLLAESLIQLRMYQEALKAVDHVLTLQPDHPQAGLERANLLYLLNQLDAAQSHLASLGSRFDDSSTLWNLKGNVNHALGLFHEAEIAYRKAVDLDPEMPLYQSNLARTLLIRGNDTEALHWFRQSARVLFREGAYDELSSVVAHIVRLDPADQETQAIRGKVLFHEGKTAEAEATFAELLDSGYRDSATSYLMGLISAERGNRSEAIGHLRTAVEAEPGEALYRFRLAENQFLSGQDCHHELTAALCADPDDPWILNLAGQVWLSDGELRDAEQAYAQAHTALPQEPEILINYTSCLVRMGRAGEAKVLLDDALINQDDNVRLLNQRANVLAGQERLREALADYERALKIEPGNTDTIKNAAAVCIELDLVHRAEELLGYLTDREPTADVYNLNASFALITGERGRALLSLKKGLELEPGNIDLRLNMAIFHMGREEFQRAREVVNGVLADEPDSHRAKRLLARIRERWEEEIMCGQCNRSWWVPKTVPPQGPLRLVGEPPVECPAGRCSECGQILCIGCASGGPVDANGRMRCSRCGGPLKLDDDKLRYLVRQHVELPENHND